MTDHRSEDEMLAVMELLDAAADCQLGVTFLPDTEGWSVGWISANRGGSLSSAFDLITAAKAAVRPLIEQSIQMGHATE